MHAPVPPICMYFPADFLRQRLIVCDNEVSFAITMYVGYCLIYILQRSTTSDTALCTHIRLVLLQDAYPGFDVLRRPVRGAF
jgi:hypothetical protein